MKFRSLTRVLWLALIVQSLILASTSASAQQKAVKDEESVHIASSSRLHQAVVSHSDQVSRARSQVADVLSQPEVRAQVQRFGVEPGKLQQKLDILSDSEILQLQSQIMPLAEQMETAAQDGGNRKTVLLWVLVAAVAALTIAMFMYYS